MTVRSGTETGGKRGPVTETPKYDTEGRHDAEHVPAPRPFAGVQERKAYARAWRDRQRLPELGYVFDTAAGQRVVDFIQRYCRHYKGEWSGKLMVLEPWQRFCIREAFGWYKPDPDWTPQENQGPEDAPMVRRYRYIWMEIPRKNGKSQLGGGIGLYLTVADQEPGAEVYSTATKRDQAKIVFSAARQMVLLEDRLKKFCRPLQANISMARNMSKFEPLSAEGDTLDGLNPHGNIVDEIHAHRNRTVWDVMMTAMGARRQPMTLVITTAGAYEPEQIGWQQHDYAAKVLDQAIEDDTQFVWISSADPDDAWDDPDTWKRANPNWAVSVKPSYIADLASKAANQPGFITTFKQKHLNMWTQAREVWLNMDHWNGRCRQLGDPPLEELAGAKAWGGLDLSSKLDLTAYVLCVPHDGTYWFLPMFFLPEERLVTRMELDRVPYDQWAQEGLLHLTPGDVIDYEEIEQHIAAATAPYKLVEVAYDPWNAEQTAQRLKHVHGMEMVEMRQGYASMSEPCKDYEALVTKGAVGHGGHPILTWMATNASVNEDPHGNIKLDKRKSTQRIDGIVASVMALARALVAEEKGPSVYERRGIVILGDDEDYDPYDDYEDDELEDAEEDHDEHP